MRHGRGINIIRPTENLVRIPCYWRTLGHTCGKSCRRGVFEQQAGSKGSSCSVGRESGPTRHQSGTGGCLEPRGAGSCCGQKDAEWMVHTNPRQGIKPQMGRMLLSTAPAHTTTCDVTCRLQPQQELSMQTGGASVTRKICIAQTLKYFDRTFPIVRVAQQDHMQTFPVNIKMAGKRSLQCRRSFTPSIPSSLGQKFPVRS